MAVMIPPSMGSKTNVTTAYLAPFMAFIAISALGSLPLFKNFNGLWLSAPQYWVYPLQAVICGAILLRFWNCYAFGRVQKLGFTLFIALLVFGIWVSPQALLHFPVRTIGFDPTIFDGHFNQLATALSFRFLRLVVVVPLMEEVFWRGFLLRDLINPDDFTQVPIGSYSRNSCMLVALAFAFAHWGPDFIPALITGFLYNWVAYRTRSLASCVMAHSITNLVLGVYILKTEQWGFW